MLRETILKIKEKALQNHVPIVRDKTIQCIIDILKNSNICSILEIGTAVGYSGIVMLANSQASLTTIEKNEDRVKEAQINFKSCGLVDRVTQIQGDAQEEIEKLVLSKSKFDFIFLDGPKGQYIKYYPFLKQLLNQKGVLFADNILVGGLLEDETRVNHKNRAMVRNMKLFLKTLQNDIDFDTKLYKIDDGFSISQLI